MKPADSTDALLRIGTSGWSYAHWKRNFYPDKISSGEMLSSYAEHFDTVEVNATFYHLPSVKTIKNWTSAAPENFLFSVKASRYITHLKKLNDPEKSLENILGRLVHFGEKLGPILFQLPPNWHKDIERLRSFVNLLPDKHRYVFEFRDDSWFDDDVVALLDSHQIACCLYDLEGEQSPDYLTTDFAYIRLHGPGARYQGCYSQKLLKPWVQRIHAWLDNKIRVYCYFNNDFGGYAPKNALSLKEMLQSVIN